MGGGRCREVVAIGGSTVFNLLGMNYVLLFHFSFLLMSQCNHNTLSGKISSGKIFVGENVRHLTQISLLFPDENFPRQKIIKDKKSYVFPKNMYY